jgi:predicted membrane metal-binding protein
MRIDRLPDFGSIRPMAGTGTHESFERGEVKASSDRSFGLVFAAVFAILGVWPAVFGRGLRLWALALAVAFLAAALAYPRVLHPLNSLWFRIGLLLHKVVTPIVMGLIFSCGIVPTALIMRVRHRDPLRIEGHRRGETTWVVRSPPGPSPDSMKRLF